MCPRQLIRSSEDDSADLADMRPEPPVPRQKRDELKAEALLSYQPPYTVEEIKAMFPGLYFPVHH
jgi:hypothetical protein